MATNNREREELHKTIWSIAEELRGAVDGWEFKAYVLGAIFYRYISENLTSYINHLQAEAGIEDFDYAKMSDAEAEEARETMVQEKGFFILPSQLFQNVAERPEANVNLNETLANVFRSIEASAAGTESEEQVKGLFSDFIIDSSRIGNSVDLRNKCISKVLTKVRDMKLSQKFTDNSIDTVGDSYEFLMQMYASNAGKSGGEFFTPQEVSEVLARIASFQNPHIRKVYDPACGSGSLLMKFVKYAGDEAKDIEFYGQEINPTTYNLCRINMFLHDVNYAKFDIQLGNTLTTPHHLGMKFDAIVSNPPYSKAWEGKTNPILINDERYSPAGVLAPTSKSDLAFTMHMLYHLSETGTCAIVEFPGVLYRNLTAEVKIREYLVKNNFVDTVIQLPANLFFGVPIDTCIIVLKKNKKDNNVLFVDASKEYIKNGNKNKLEQKNQDVIVNAYIERKEKQYFSKLVSNDEILTNASNLAVGSYVEKKKENEKIDIELLNSEIDDLSNKVANDSLKLNNANIDSNNKIEEKLKALCPKGVNFEKLYELLDYVQPNPFIVKSTEYNDNYSIPVLTAGQSFILGYTNEMEGIYKATPQNPVIIFDDFTTGFHWVDFDFKVKSSALKILKPKNDKNDIRYIYMAMKTIKYIPSNHKRHWISIYSKFEIPLPEPDIQKEIVSELDAFTSHINKLKKLISLRQKQYEYYREKLLTFE